MRGCVDCHVCGGSGVEEVYGGHGTVIECECTNSAEQTVRVDIVSVLRTTAWAAPDADTFTKLLPEARQMLNVAANEIEHLRSILRRIDDVTTWETTPLGRRFQDEVEAALGIGQQS